MIPEFVYDHEWLRTSESISLPDSVAHVWYTRIDRQNVLFPELAETLSIAERSRVARLAFEDSRFKATVSRGMLRMLLAKYMHCAPHSLQIEITDSGKPYSAESSAPFFNVSHSGQMIAIAFSRNHPLGIDVEAIRSLPDAQKLAERYFFPREAEILKRLPSEEQGRFFFDCWVHKEAYMKALGKGFALSLRSFEVTDEQTQPFISPDDYRAWYYYPLHPAPGYVGALFIGDRAHEIRCWQID